MARIDNLGDKANTNGFDKNKDNINKLGRPRKSFNSINHKLKEAGVKPVSKKELVEFYGNLFNLTFEELKDIRDNPETPYALKLIIQELGNASTRSRALQDFRDYMFKDQDTGPETRFIGYGKPEAEQNFISPPDEG